MSGKYNLIICIFCLYITFECTSVLGKEKCAVTENCEECLAEDYSCAWCTDKSFDMNSRCQTKADLLSLNCMEANIIENNEQLQVIEDDPNQDYEIVVKKKMTKAIQLRPQKLKMKLIKGRTQQFKMTYKIAENYPLDLYFLMDLTWSMKDDRDTLIQLGNELSKTLVSLTKNHRLGFGSFADKPGMPINPSKKFEENPCSYANEGEVCEPTYDFKHQLELTSDIKSFIDTVKNSKITGNLENMEGQLDALMQVIVCTDKIGWSNDARKIVVLATDGYMHFAGDGLLLGVIQKNDKQCHLNDNGLYDGDLMYDYPSIEEIYRELLKRKINVIFAVEQTVSSHYQRMGELMQEVSAIEILSANSSNILDLVRKAYKSFTNKIQFEDISPDIISVKYFTDCGGKYDTLRKRNSCKNIKVGDEIDFYVNVTLEEFPTDNNWTHTLRIEDSGLSESVEIQVEIQKPCPCTEEPIKDESGRHQCNNNGHLKCGMCVCDEHWLGTFCSCNSENSTTYQALENQCRNSVNEKQGPICSNQGECECGKCQCNSDFEGKYCECPKCPYCNSENEKCVCGRCTCKFGWHKDRCCVKRKNGCINPIDRSICSNNGECDTCKDTCSCNDEFLGKYCEYKSTDTKTGFCEKYESCVKLLIQSKDIKENIIDVETVCADQKGQYTYLIQSEQFDSELKCFLRLDSEYGPCDHYFEYKIDENELSHLKIMKANCEPVNFLAVGGYFGLGTFLLGFLIILATLFIIKARDRREYEKFNNEVLLMQEKFKGNERGENPLYKNPVTHYSIPKLDED